MRTPFCHSRTRTGRGRRSRSVRSLGRRPQGMGVFPQMHFCRTWRPTHGSGIVTLMQCHKVWRKQCQATRAIRRRFGLKNALDYLVSEKLLNFAEAAEQHPEFAAELPRFQAAVWEVFHPYELAEYTKALPSFKG